MTESHEPNDQFDDDTLDRALDGGFAAAGDAADRDEPSPSPSVLDRIGEVTGSRPKVSLRDADPSGQTPMLKPLTNADEREAGKYVVQGELGRGGVGAVHRGHDQDLGRDVAMKFLHDRYKDEPAVLHRFVEEAQIGGQLQHPGIVPVYDLGMAQGRPFFTMKLVKGETLSKKLADRESPADDRRTFLSVFEDVCQTMAYAHARGVVHRDLKPANIMIGSFGEVQVVDWGMGKVLASGGVADEQRAAEKQTQVSVIETVRSSGHGTQSVMGSVMGTPAYMPPEQARGDVDAMDERSDVFALGAILCEILTGAPPYVGEHEELIGMAAMGKLDDAHERLRSCGAEADLVELTTQCLMPAPAARPQSAEKVAAAIHEHLAAVEARVHEARVEAAEATVRTAALKRQRTLGLGLTAAIAAGLVVSLWFWQEADTQRVLAEEQRDQVERIADFMGETLAGAEPSVALGRDTTMLEEMMAAAASRIEEGELEDAPDAELQLRTTIGSTYQGLSQYEAARRMLEPAVEQARSRHPGDHAAKASAIFRLADVLTAIGDDAGAKLLFREALAIRRRLFPGDHADVAEALQQLGYALLHGGGDRTAAWAEAEELCREALAMFERLHSGDHVNLAKCRTRLAHVLSDRKKTDEAISHYRAVLAMYQRLHEGDHPDIANALKNIASALEDDDPESERLLRRSLEMERRLLDGDHSYLVATLTSLTVLLRERREFKESASLGREALEMARRLYPGDHLVVANCLNNLANSLDDRAAVPLLRESVEIKRRLYPDGHRHLATSIINLAGSLMRLGDRTNAARGFREGIEMWRRLDAGDHVALVVGLEGLGTSLDDKAEAEQHLREALAIGRRLWPDDKGKVANVMEKLGVCLLEKGDLAEARGPLRDALAMRRQLSGIDPVLLASSLNSYGVLQQRQGKLAEAEALFREALMGPCSALGGEHASTLMVLGNLAFVLRGQRKLAEAEPIRRQVLDARRRADPPNEARIASAAGLLGKNLYDQRKFADAEVATRECLQIRERLLPANDWRLHNARHIRGAVLGGLGQYTEAETLLVDAVEWMLTSPEMPSNRQHRAVEAAERVVAFYESWHAAEPGKGYDQKAAEWRKRVAKRE